MRAVEFVGPRGLGLGRLDGQPVGQHGGLLSHSHEVEFSSLVLGEAEVDAAVAGVRASGW